MNTWRYASGDVVQPGDYIRYRGQDGRIEFVASGESGEATTDWYVTEFGGGVMVSIANFGSIFLPGTEIDAEVELLERAVTNRH